MIMPRPLRTAVAACLAACLGALAFPAAANDSEAEIGLGGLELVRNTAVSMEEYGKIAGFDLVFDILRGAALNDITNINKPRIRWK